MALFHMHCKVIQRSKGKSAVAAAAYRSGSSIESDYDGTTYSYIKKAGVVASEIVAPEGSPLWITDRSKLWNAVEAIEKRKDAQLAREIELALPLELDAKAKQDLAREFVISEFVNHGMVADMNYHDKDGTNPHVHIMLTTRELTPEGFGKKNREWNSKDLLLDWRKKWEEKLNLALKKAGIEEQVCCESYTAQEIDREPQIHIGVHAAAMEARGIETERGDINRGIVARNAKKEIAQILDLEQKARIKTAESSRILADIEAVDETQSAAQKWKAEQIQRLKAERAEETTKTRKAEKSKDEMEKRHKAERDELYGVPWDERGKEWDVNKMVLQSQQLKETLEMEQMLEQARERAADEASKPKAGVAGQSLPTPRQRESVKKTVADRHDMGASQERPSNGQISEIGTPRPESELSDEVPVPLVSATETATPKQRPSVSDEATVAAKVVPTGGEAKRTLNSGAKPKTTAESAPNAAGQRAKTQPPKVAAAVASSGELGGSVEASRVTPIGAAMTPNATEKEKKGIWERIAGAAKTVKDSIAETAERRSQAAEERAAKRRAEQEAEQERKRAEAETAKKTAERESRKINPYTAQYDFNLDDSWGRAKRPVVEIEHNATGKSIFGRLVSVQRLWLKFWMTDRTSKDFSANEYSFYLATPEDRQRFETEVEKHRGAEKEKERKAMVRELHAAPAVPEVGAWISWVREKVDVKDPIAYGTGKIKSITGGYVVVGEESTIREVRVPVTDTLWGRDAEARNAEARERATEQRLIAREQRKQQERGRGHGGFER